MDYQSVAQIPIQALRLVAQAYGEDPSMLLLDIRDHQAEINHPVAGGILLDRDAVLIPKNWRHGEIFEPCLNSKRYPDTITTSVGDTLPQKINAINYTVVILNPFYNTDIITIMHLHPFKKQQIILAKSTLAPLWIPIISAAHCWSIQFLLLFLTV